MPLAYWSIAKTVFWTVIRRWQLEKVTSLHLRCSPGPIVKISLRTVANTLTYRVQIISPIPTWNLMYLEALRR